MTTLPSLPAFDLYIGFYQFNGSTAPLIEYASSFPLPASGASNTQWTNASKYLLNHQLSWGKQHYLDRAQPASATITLNARDGFFFNGTTNGQGVTLRRQMPVAITATVSGTQYPVYMGFIQQVHENPIDQVNDVIVVDAVDFTGLLAVASATNPNLYSTYANSANAAHWYRLGVPQTVNILSAFNYKPSWVSGVTVGAGSEILYVTSGNNNFTVSEYVTTSGLTGVGTNTNSLTYSGMIITQVVGQYVVASPILGSIPVPNVSSQGTGTMYNVALYDQIGSDDGTIVGLVSWPNAGALVYDSDECVDLGSGGFGGQSGWLSWPTITSTYGVECWVLGLNMVGQTIISMADSTSTVRLDFELDGTLILVTTTSGLVVTTYHGSSISVTDGSWHHVGVFLIAGTVYIYCDGGWTSTGYTMIGTHFVQDTFFNGFAVGNGNLGQRLGAYIDEVIFSSSGIGQTEVESRYIVGSLCQKQAYSGDRIAELLFIAGFGSVRTAILGIATPTGFFQIGTSYGSVTDYNVFAGPGAGSSQVEPYYWDTPITGSMIMDLINQVTTTDYGVFLELPSGKFAFYTQSWFGTWAYTENARTQQPSSYSWTPRTSSWSAAPTLSDDGTGIAYVPSSLAILSDGSDLYTQVDVNPQAGQRQVIELSASNTSLYGSQTLQVSSNLPTSLTQARSLGWYLGYLFRPSLLRRADSVMTGTEQGNGTNNATLLQLFIWSVVFFKRTPPNASAYVDPTTDDGQINYAMAIEKMQMDFDSEGGYVHWTFGLSPYEVGS